MTTCRNSIQDGTKFFCRCHKNPSDDTLESLYKLRIRESYQLKTVLELHDMESHQKISVPNYQKLKTVVKRIIGQKLRLQSLTQEWENWIRSSDKEPKGSNRRWRRKRYLLPVERKRPVFARRPLQFPPRSPRSCAKTRTRCRHTFWANRITRSKCVEEEKYPRQK